MKNLDGITDGIGMGLCEECIKYPHKNQEVGEIQRKFSIKSPSRLEMECGFCEHNPNSFIFYEEYRRRLEMLEKRGLHDGVIQNLLVMGMHNSRAYVDALLTATDEEINAINNAHLSNLSV